MYNAAVSGQLRMRRKAPGTIILAFVAALLAWNTPAVAVTVSDSTFLDTDWTLTQFTSGTGGSVTAAQVLSGGNPGSFRNVTDTLTGGGTQSVVLGASIYAPFTYDPGVSGAIATLDYTEDAACTSGCFGSGQSTGPAILQGGNMYILGSTLITGPGTAFVNHTLNGLTALDFGLVSLTASTIVDTTQHPDFSAGGAPIKVGFFRANGTGPGGIGYALAAGIDNWQVSVVPTAGPPPPPVFTQIPTLDGYGMALLVAALGVLGLRYLRRTG